MSSASLELGNAPVYNPNYRVQTDIYLNVVRKHDFAMIKIVIFITILVKNTT